jgi:hypothetical protein
MALTLRRALTAGCIALLLLAGAWTLGTLRAPDPRARGAWADNGAALASGAPIDVTLYLPACAMSAIRLHAAQGHGGSLTAEVVRGPSASASQAILSPPVERRFDGRGVIDLPLHASPARERVRLRLIASTPGIALDAARPFSLVPETDSRLGLLPCVVDGRTDLAWVLLAVVALHLAGLGWLAAMTIAPGAADRPGPATARAATSTAGAVGLVASTLLLYAIVVPPFEPPDELAHVQYARYVALTGALPREVPPEDSEWRSSVYEWVQQPAYYLLAAGVLRVTGDAPARPAPEVHPQSRLSGGPDVNIYRHPDTTSASGALRALWTLRVLSVLMTLVTVWCAVRAVTLATADARLGVAAGASLALVPQWAAVMGIASTDPPATMAAAVAALLLCRLTHAPGRWLLGAAAGIATGVAYACKATSVFLVPMAAVGLVVVARAHGGRVARRHAMAFAGGVLLAAAWIPLRAWVVFGDPLARAFKREVLAIGGFVVTDGPAVFSTAFAEQMRLMVFEPFWARFGSLGAGPLPGTRLWWVYGVVTAGLLAAFAVGAARSAWSTWRRVPGGDDRGAVVLVCAFGVVSGVALWAWVNLVPQADVIVHWTPRHILPLTVPLLVVVASGLQALVRGLSPSLRTALRVGTGLGIMVLAVTGLAVLRSVVLGFHFGY